MSYLSALWLPGTYCPDCGAENVYQTLDRQREVCLTCARRPEPVPDALYPEYPEQPEGQPDEEVSHAR